MLEEEQQEGAQPGDAAETKVDGEAGGDKKVSTSGNRESRRETWRAAKGWKPRKGSKNGGKPKRRR
ncbi:hypothetical protein BCV69DRAFT_279668 [Microstroma glucosiphilum]|uniref:Uncharacterized protein n=1 Tax=Pseudomicrostroma glucosiphilum TaxID=1684307 RepID=A0A316UKJ2_9BASI|nr:hypothetical protein BCV69DRAFT_279668 [Pseudomicrostroma glucosiphilum]PWN23745.1 hypothetical protein BCV69DRAFT_279668 [Pseudomicrostroma glucosiphilum]